MEKTLYIYVPGLGGEDILQKQRQIISNWQSKKRDTHFLESKWTDQSEDYPEKIKRLLKEVSKINLSSYKSVCIVGTSAGGTLGLNLFSELKSKIKNLKFVSVSGKITGVSAIGRSYSQPHPALIPSVKKSEKVINELSDQHLNNIQSVIPLVDEVVYKRFMKIQGANHKRIYVLGHIFSIYHSIKHPKRYIFNFVEN